MFSAADLFTLSGASVVTSAVWGVVHQLKSDLPSTPSIIVIGQLVVWLATPAMAHPTVRDAALCALSGLLVSAPVLGGMHGIARHRRHKRRDVP